METRASYVAVGVFTLLCVAGALIFVLWTAGSQQRTLTPYDIFFRQGVSGLSVGNDVLFNGVRVGQVKQIKISPTDPGIVQVRIEVAADTPVRKNSVANQEARGITGLTVVAISGGTADSPMLKASEEEVAVIPSRLSGLQELMATAPNLLGSVNLLLDRANGMLSTENAQNFARMLHALTMVADTVAEQRHSLGLALASIGEAAQNFAKASRRIDALAASTQTLVNDKMTRAADSVDKAAVRLDRVLEEVEPGMTQFSREGLDTLQRLLAEARNLMNDLTRLTRKMESDPRRLLFGNTVPEYTTP